MTVGEAVRYSLTLTLGFSIIVCGLIELHGGRAVFAAAVGVLVLVVANLGRWHRSEDTAVPR